MDHWAKESLKKEEDASGILFFFTGALQLYVILTQSANAVQRLREFAFLKTITVLGFIVKFKIDCVKDKKSKHIDCK
jgi:hypothetical protein